MTALAGARLNMANKGPTTLSFGRTTKSGKVFFAGALVVLEPVGKFLQPATGAAGEIVVGVVDLDNKLSVSTVGGVDGDTTLVVRSGIFPFAIGSGGDALVKANEMNDVYAIDDQTVGATDGGTGRPIAGQLFLITDNNGNANPTGTLAWVSVGGPRAVSQTASSVQRGSSEIVSAAGAISVLTEISYLNLPTGASALTLANGTYKGQRKVIETKAITGSPNGTLTPTTPTGFSTISGMGGALGRSAELEWDGTGWGIVSNSGNTVA